MLNLLFTAILLLQDLAGEERENQNRDQCQRDKNSDKAEVELCARLSGKVFANQSVKVDGDGGEED